MRWLWLVWACSGTDPVEEETSAEVQPGVWRVDGLSPDLPSDDLAPLWDLVGDARLIGLGESVHTSGGYYAAKNRLIQDLVRNRGVRAFGMETPRTAAAGLNAWLSDATCAGVEGEVLRGMFRVFADTNTADLFSWLCTWNQEHPDDTVAFFGFDVQQGATDLAFLREELAAEPDLLAGLSACQSYDSLGATVPWSFSLADHDACLAGTSAIRAWLPTHAVVDLLGTELALIGVEAEQRSLYWDPQYNGALGDRDAILMDEGRYLEAFNRSTEARDAAMAEVLTRLADAVAPTGQVVVWAHNGHLAMNHDDARDAYAPDASAVAYGVTMGTLLGDELGDDWAPVAITASNPEINWPGIGEGPTGMHEGAGALERRLKELGEAQLIVDPASPWVAEPGDIVEVGGQLLVLPDTYRAVVYLRSSPAMDALGW